MTTQFYRFPKIFLQFFQYLNMFVEYVFELQIKYLYHRCNFHSFLNLFVLCGNVLSVLLCNYKYGMLHKIPMLAKNFTSSWTKTLRIRNICPFIQSKTLTLNLEAIINFLTFFIIIIFRWMEMLAKKSCRFMFFLYYFLFISFHLFRYMFFQMQFREIFTCSGVYIIIISKSKSHIRTIRWGNAC